MGKEILRQRNWNAGELDENLYGRQDIKSYFNGAALIENCSTLPQGPLTRRPGFSFVDYVRRELAPVDLAGATLAAPNGGTAADAAAVGGSPLTTVTAIGVTNPYVILEVDFPAPVTVHLVDLVDFGLDDGSAPLTPPFVYPWPGAGGGGFIPTGGEYP